MLTVKKAIEQLSKFPPDSQLVVWMPGQVVVLDDKAFTYKETATAFEGNMRHSFEPWQVSTQGS